MQAVENEALRPIAEEIRSDSAGVSTGWNELSSSSNLLLMTL